MDYFKKNDIYIFHIPVINAFMHNAIRGWTGFASSPALSVAVAGLPWFLVEKSALGMRHSALYPALTALVIRAAGSAAAMNDLRNRGGSPCSYQAASLSRDH